MSADSRASPRRLALVILGIVFVVILGIATALILLRLGLKRGLEAQLQAIRAVGLPTSGAELDTWYAPVPDEENAALVLQQAFALLREYPDERSKAVARFKIPERQSPLTSTQQVLLKGYVELNSAALAKAQEGLVLAQSRYPVSLAPGLNASLPHLTKLKELARVAEFEALLAAQAGQAEKAADAITTMAGVARTLDPEPLLISQLMRMALISMSITGLERSVNLSALDDVACLKLGEVFALLENTNLIVRALIGERAFAIEAFPIGSSAVNNQAALGSGGGGTPPGQSLSSAGPSIFNRLTGFFDRDLQFYLRAMQTNIAMLSQLPPASLAVTNVNAQLADEAEHKYFIFSGLLLPAVGKASMREAEIFARIRSATTALALERFRLANGALPKELSELVPRFLSHVPGDPFDGRPLRYKLLPKGYVVYSVGPDGRDDGGKELPAKNSGPGGLPYDITFTVER